MNMRMAIARKAKSRSGGVEKNTKSMPKIDCKFIAKTINAHTNSSKFRLNVASTIILLLY